MTAKRKAHPNPLWIIQTKRRTTLGMLALHPRRCLGFDKLPGTQGWHTWNELWAYSQGCIFLLTPPWWPSSCNLDWLIIWECLQPQTDSALAAPFLPWLGPLKSQWDRSQSQLPKLFWGGQRSWCLWTPCLQGLASGHPPPSFLQKTLGCPGSQSEYNSKCFCYTHSESGLLFSDKMKNK